MKKKDLKKMKIYRTMFNLVGNKKFVKIMMINQILICSTPIIVEASYDESQAVVFDKTVEKNEDYSNKKGVLIPNNVVRERNKYINNIADFYGVEEEVVSDTLKDISKKELDELTSSLEPELLVVDYVQEKIDSKNISTPTNVVFDFSNSAEEIISEVKNSEIGAIYEKYGKMYGVDPNLLMARDMQESGLRHDSFNDSGAYGISQIEHTLFGSQVHTFNYDTNSYEDFTITQEGARELDTNIKYGAAKMQERIRNYDGNIYIALQAYNYGPAINIALDSYASEIGKTREEVIANKEDFGWLKYIDDIHYNPSKYIDWSYGTYGDNEYISHIMRYIPEDIIQVKDKDRKSVV